MESFKKLGLSDEALEAISELGFETPSEIQEKAIPLLLNGDKDFIGLAQTGTGKTAAFGLPLLESIDPSSPATQALILAPTRELGQQIAEQLALFSKYMPRVNCLAVYGGANIATQIKALRKPQQVVIATPGRLLDLIRRKAIKLGKVDYLILDEADEMLNMGFKEDLDSILSFTPDSKRTWLFSATMPGEIRRIVKQYMHNPVEVKINPKNQVNENIEHRYAIVKHSDKTEALTRFLDLNPDMRGLVFCRTRRDTQGLAEMLLAKNYKADAIHGDLSQAQRDTVMKRFKDNKLQVLVATDVAARGIDVNDLTHVFHYTLPDDLPYYTHRSGRTARAGKKGTSIAFINGREKSKIDRITKRLDVSFEKIAVPNSDEIASLRLENWCKDILTTKTKGKIEDDLLDRANLLFGNLSKEELTAKILVRELESIDLGSSGDLNASISKDRGSRSKGGGGRGRSHHRKGRKGGKGKKFKHGGKKRKY